MTAPARGSTNCESSVDSSAGYSVAIPRTTQFTTETLKFIAALTAVYLLWGSTYLAIRIVVASVPPLIAAGTRFLIAGVLLYGWGRIRRAPAPSRKEWKNVCILGALMFFICYSSLFWAEKTLPSGLASVLVATLPLWTLIMEVFILRTQRLTSLLCIGLAMGFAGVVAISLATGGGMNGALRLPTFAVLGSVVCWAVGSILSKRLEVPAVQSINAGAQMMTGGCMLLIASLLAGEWKVVTVPPSAAVFGLIYLIVAGSIIAFSAFVWLLKRMGPTRVSSYAYVNPVVALALGYFFGNERFPSGAIIGSLLVLSSVILILSGKEAKKPASVGTH